MFAVCCSLACLSFVDRGALFVVLFCCALFVVRCVPFVVCCLIVVCLSFAIRFVLFVACLCLVLGVCC